MTDVAMEMGEVIQVAPSQKKIVIGETNEIDITEKFTTWNGQLFLTQSLIESVFKLDLVLSDNQQALLITSDRPLPIDRRQMRERRWARFSQPDFSVQTKYRSVEKAYALWGSPKGEIRLSSFFSNSNTGTNLSGAFEAEAGYLSNNVFFSLDDQNGFNSIRWSGGRVSPEGRAFGLSNVYQLTFGDINGQRLPLTGTSSSGRGIFFSTAPLARPALFDVTQIRGDALPGWDVELYRSGALIDFLTVGADGEYVFNDVPLGFGNNEIKIVLYGPQGQVEERISQQNFAAGQLRPGDWQLSGSILDRGAQTFDLNKRRSLGGEQASFRVDYGLSRSLTTGVFVDLSRQTWQELGFLNDFQPPDATDEDHIKLTNLGVVVRPALGLVTTEWVGVAQNEGEYAVEGLSRFSMLGLNLSAKMAHFSPGFISRERGSVGGGDVTTRMSLRASQSLGRLGSVSLDYGRFELTNGGLREEWAPRWRHRLMDTSVSHEFRLTEQGRFRSAQYRLLGSRRWGDWSTRFQLQASGRDLSNAELNTLSLNADYRWGNNQSLSLTTQYGIRSDSLSISGQFSSQWGAALFSTTASFNQSGSWSAGLSVSFGLGSRGQQPLAFLPAQTTRGGALEVNIFEDVNGDGIFSEVDRPVPDATVAVNGRSDERLSDANGQLLVLGLPTRSPVDIELDIDSLPNPFLTTSQPRVRFTPRPGFTHRINMPLQDSAFVTGDVSQYGQPLAGLEVTARRVDGLAEETVLSFSDGYFAFERLAPGRWEIYVDAEVMPEGWQSTQAIVEVDAGASLDNISIQVSPPLSESDEAR